MTGSDLMIEVMGRFNEGEPQAVMVVWTDENGDVCCKTNCSHTQSIGMAEYAKALAISAIMESKQ